MQSLSRNWEPRKVGRRAQLGCLLNSGRRRLGWPLKLGGARKGSGPVPNGAGN